MAISNPQSVIGLELYEQDGKTGWFAVSYDYDDGGCWIQFEHYKFQPWDCRLDKLEAVIDLNRGLNYLRQKA